MNIDYFKNDSQVLTMTDTQENELSIENGTEQVVLHGSLALSLDKESIQQLDTLIDNLTFIKETIKNNLVR